MATLLNNEKYSRYYQRVGAMYQRPEVKASLEVIFSVFMVTLLIFVAIRPTLINLAALQKKITDKENVSAKADKKIAQLFSAQEQLDSNSLYLPLFESAVPEKFSYLEIIGRMEAVARNNLLAVDSISVQGASLVGDGKAVGEWAAKLIKTDAVGMMVIPVDFTLLGKPQQIKKFLIDIENLDRLGVIKNVNLAKDSGTTKISERLKATGQINFYVYAQKK